MGFSYDNITLSTLRGRVRERIINTFWSDTEIDDGIREAIRVWNALTGFFRDQNTGSIDPGTVDVTITTNIASTAVAILRMETTDRHLDPVTVEELGQFNPTWQEDTASAANVTNWIPMGLNKLALYPVPTGAFAFDADYLRTAIVPTDNGDFVQIPQEEINTIVDYVQFFLVLKEGGEELKQAIPLLQNFLARAAKYNSKLMNSAIFRRFLGMPQGGQAQQSPSRLNRKVFR